MKKRAVALGLSLGVIWQPAPTATAQDLASAIPSTRLDPEVDEALFLRP